MVPLPPVISFNPYVDDLDSNELDIMYVNSDGTIGSSTGTLEDTRHNSAWIAHQTAPEPEESEAPTTAPSEEPSETPQASQTPVPEVTSAPEPVVTEAPAAEPAPTEAPVVTEAPVENSTEEIWDPPLPDDFEG